MIPPYYHPTANEVQIFQSALANKIPVLLKGPTGCGKSRFLEFMAHQSNRSLVTVSCNEDTSGADLLGRFLLKGNETVWNDGPVTYAAREGALLYFDEIVEAREDVLVLLHSLADHRRELYIDRTKEIVRSHPNFQLVASFNPGYQSSIKEMKASTRQRFVAIPFFYPSENLETEIIMRESSCTLETAKKLAEIAKNIRSLKNLDLRETVSTRLLVHTAKLFQSGLSLKEAIIYGIVEVLSDDRETTDALTDFISLKI